MQSLIRFLLLLTLPLLSSCSEIAGGPVQGTVVDRSTGKPVEGAKVVVKWYAAMSGMSPWYPCYHVEVATTDKAGKFLVPRWRVDASAKDAPQLLKDLNYFNMSSLDKPIQTHVYKPGYEGIEKDWSKREDPIIPMSPFRGTASERVENLLFLKRKIECEAGMEPVIPVLWRMLEEGREIAKTPSALKDVEAFLTGVESYQYGSKEAMRRGTERDKQRSREQKQ